MNNIGFTFVSFVYFGVFKCRIMLKVFTTHQSTHSTSVATFVALCGVSPMVADYIWAQYGSTQFKQVHLLWTLSFLAVYSHSDIILASLWGVSISTYTDAVWPIIEHLFHVMREVRFI